jgi:hypothetical protein
MATGGPPRWHSSGQGLACSPAATPTMPRSPSTRMASGRPARGRRVTEIAEVAARAASAYRLDPLPAF